MLMAHLNYFLFCEDATVDGGGKHTLVGIFDTIGVVESQLPVPASVFKIAFSFMPDDSDVNDGIIKIRIEVTNPEGEQKGTLEVEAKPTDPTKATLTPLASSLDISNDFVVTRIGTYNFSFYVNNNLITSRPLHIIPTKEQKDDVK